MKEIPQHGGSLKNRPFFEDKDIEETCEKELSLVGLLPNEPSSIRIDRFIEKKFDISTSYDSLKEGIIGYTLFGKDGVEKIVISRELDEDDSIVSERRIRTTMAHESGHGLLHAQLFYLGKKPLNLFHGESSNEPIIMCRKSNIPGILERSSDYKGDWWEFQANAAMGALLLPFSLVNKALEPFLLESGLLGKKTLIEDKREEACRTLVSIFDVNPIVAKIRLDKLFPDSSLRQQTL
jgi:hypothetical protein